ncbi:MAG: hypothetical protein IJS60_05625 [Abditibacteriota bacterium]|nr:hypothetical protein [Abditibacteriota bacterium]
MKKVSDSEYLELKTLKDRVQEILGQIDDASNKPTLKANKETLKFCAQELHKSADQLVWIVTRLK